MCSSNIRRQQDGFTLVEIAIVLVIIGLLVGNFIGSFAERVETTRRNDTKNQLKDIKVVLLGFASKEGRLPCPTTPTGSGQEQPVGGGVCTLQHGFIPGRTLGINGTYNRDNLLTDSWGNPIRYSVSIVASSAFTTAGLMKTTTMAGLNPDIIICNGDSISGSACTNAAGTLLTLVDNAAFIVLSLGKDGSEMVTTVAANSAQGENSGEALVLVNAVGENLAYTVGANRVFVKKSYSSINSNAGQFDDLILWVSPYVLFNRMIDAGQLP